MQPKLSNDMSALANSVEFETYKFNDMSASKTSFCHLQEFVMVLKVIWGKCHKLKQLLH